MNWIRKEGVEEGKMDNGLYLAGINNTCKEGVNDMNRREYDPGALSFVSWEQWHGHHPHSTWQEWHHLHHP
ncbi:hypothetical protein COC69_12725 [Bacillus cereus]|uniref:Uncharacterized protein n=1 Tax=Bacillus cereus TaxID=1396 RepID=A0A9X7CNN0_BACCE|nr:hypothetical protein [Bacillus cereus]PGS79158.1 hypothetical protein COC69_12725 [Bacillus cereus]